MNASTLATNDFEYGARRASGPLVAMLRGRQFSANGQSRFISAADLNRSIASRSPRRRCWPQGAALCRAIRVGGAEEPQDERHVSVQRGAAAATVDGRSKGIGESSRVGLQLVK